MPSKLINTPECDIKATVVFAHGAGADKESDFLEVVTKRLIDAGIKVIRFNFPYMDKRAVDGKRRPPDRMPTLIGCMEEVITEHLADKPLFLMGKSMGSRVAATITQQGTFPISGVIALGYPFHPQKKPEKLRLTPLQNHNVPVLIVQGERDPLGNQQEIANYELSSTCQYLFLTDGDHDLKPRVKSGFTHQQHLDSAVAKIVEFISEQT
ncbi:alpha/beta family hydrolase [Thalassotalea ganghwensis]